MKVAELYAELGITVKDESALKSFDALLTNMAAQAKLLADSLARLSGINLPRVPTTVAVTTQGGATSGGGRRVGPGNRVVPGMTAFIGPVQPAAAAPTAIPPGMGGGGTAGNTAVTQGLKSLATFAKQLVGVGSLAYLIKQLVGGFKDMVKSAAGASFATDKFGKQTGLSLDEMKRWEKAAADAGVSTEEMQKQLASLAQQGQELKYLGQHTGAAGIASRFGISLLDTPANILTKFGRQMQNRPLSEAQAWGAQLGISPDVAYMMHTNKGILPAGMGGMALTPSQQSASLELAKSLNELKLVWDSLGNILVASVAPNLKTVADALSKMLFYLSMSSKLPNNFGGVGTIGMGIAGLFSQLPRGASAVTNNVTNYINGVNDPEEISEMITDSFFETKPNQP